MADAPNTSSRLNNGGDRLRPAGSASLALLFPGQGSQEPGMRDIVAEYRSDLLELARELVGADPFDSVDEGTRFAQPAIYCASLAGWERLGRPAAGFAAGHSLGELAALAAGGALDERDGLRLAVERGAVMQRAAEDGGGGMLALMGEREAALELATEFGLTVANDNSPEQLVVAGPAGRLDAARRAARPAGMRALRLAVRGAFHSPEMEPALEGFRAALRTVDFRPPRMRIFSCATAAEFAAPRAELAEALVRPVRWRQTVTALRDQGVERFVETGPGEVLTKLVERNLDAAVASHA
jgi:[acyl-carrier-protein] S-malonyltransferase